MANSDVNGRWVNALLIMHAQAENRGHGDNKLEYQEKYGKLMNGHACTGYTVCWSLSNSAGIVHWNSVV